MRISNRTRAKRNHEWGVRKQADYSQRWQGLFEHWLLLPRPPGTQTKMVVLINSESIEINSNPKIHFALCSPVSRFHLVNIVSFGILVESIFLVRMVTWNAEGWCLRTRFLVSSLDAGEMEKPQPLETPRGPEGSFKPEKNKPFCAASPIGSDVKSMEIYIYIYT